MIQIMFNQKDTEPKNVNYLMMFKMNCLCYSIWKMILIDRYKIMTVNSLKVKITLKNQDKIKRKTLFSCHQV
jgi:hypothetical protein